jgi:hypothetical protein
VRKKKGKVPCEEIPIFCGLVVQKGFDPDHQGPPPAGDFPGLGIDYSQHAFDLRDPRWHRTRTVAETLSALTTPTATMPTVGGDHGTTGERPLASPAGG